jgi:hypothetical protein
MFNSKVVDETVLKTILDEVATLKTPFQWRKPANAGVLLHHCQAFLPSSEEHDRQQDYGEQAVDYSQSLAPMIEPFQFLSNGNLLGDRPLGSARQVYQVIFIACSDLSRNRQTDNEQRKDKPNNPES